jgi:hypothetical protein
LFGRKVEGKAMASEQVPSLAPAPTQPLFARLGLSGKLLLIGGLAGIIVAFLPLVSVSLQMQIPGGGDPFGMLGGLGGGGQPAMSVTKTVMVFEDWRGKVGLVGYLVALIFAFVLYPPNGLRHKALSWAAVGAGLLAAGLAIWLLVLALDTGRADLFWIGSVKATPGIGAFLNVMTGLMVVAGGFLKVREEKLI